MTVLSLATAAPGRDRMPFHLLTIQPTFTVTDWSTATRVLADFLDETRAEAGCSYCGWTQSLSGDRIFISEAFRDADAVIEHVQAYKAIKPALAGAVTLERMQLHGPPDELAKCRGAMPSGTECFEALPGGFSFFSKQTGGLMTAQTLVSLKPTFVVNDWEACQPLLQNYLEKAALEPGLVYCGWSTNGEQLSCRLAHTNADGVIAHLENVASCLQDEILGGPASLERIELHGPNAQIERVRASSSTATETTLDALGVEYFATQGGFQKFECWSSYVAQPKPRFG
jgi:quinol monooxygenase YgiN